MSQEVRDAAGPAIDRNGEGDNGVSAGGLSTLNVSLAATNDWQRTSVGAADDGGTQRESQTASGSRYRAIRRHAHGGLGEVFLAEDCELDRQVALKEIREKHADNEEARQRFMREAAITGRLEHPGVVPVYGMGRYPDGRPYYAMRFIRGKELDGAIADMHGQPGGAFVDMLELSKLLARFVTVCNTIEYAHSRGVVHRDIKPANIMLGDYGETLVVDWGLAKLIDAPEVTPAEPSLSGSRDPGGNSSATRLGTTLGTPAYMSPEQAAGRIDEIGPPSDIYSLGGTLYTLLTNQPPAAGESVRDVLAAVEAGNIRRAREVNSAVPVGLEAICRKAMALQREDRYASAKQLAEDVEHWLADEPLAARPDGAWEKAARWRRRHKAWTQAGTAAMLLLTVGLTTAAVLINNSRYNEREERVRAEKALVNESAARKQARGTVDNFVDIVQDEPAFEESGLSAVRRALLDDALSYYQQFIADNRDNPQARRELAIALAEVGDITFDFQPTQAIAAYSEARPLLAEWLREHADDADATTRYVDSGRSLSRLFDNQGQRQEALTVIDDTVAFVRRRLERQPDDVPLRRALAGSLVTAAHVGSSARTADIATRFEEADRVVTEQLKSQPDDVALAYERLNLLSARALAAEVSGDPEQAIAFAETGLAAYEALPPATRERISIRRCQIQLSKFRALARYGQGRLIESRAELTAARNAVSELFSRNRRAHDLLFLWAETDYYLGAIDHQLGDNLAAELNVAQAHDKFQKLLKVYPDWRFAAEYAARCCQSLGVLRVLEKDFAKSSEWYTEAEKGYLQLEKQGWQSEELQYDIVQLYINRGINFRDSGELEKAQADLDKADQELQRRLADRLDLPRTRLLKASIDFSLGNVAKTRGDLPRALELAERARAALEPGDGRLPPLEHRDDLRKVNVFIARIHRDQGAPQEALAYTERLLDLDRAMLEQDATHPLLSRQLAASLREHAKVQGECGQHAAAAETLAEALAALEQSKPRVGRADKEQSAFARTVGRTQLQLAAALRGQGRCRDAGEMAHRVGAHRPRQADLTFEAAQELIRCSDALASGQGDAEISPALRKSAAEVFLRNAAYWLGLAAIVDDKFEAQIEQDPLTARLKDYEDVLAIAGVRKFVNELRAENAALEGPTAVMSGEKVAFVVELANHAEFDLDDPKRHELADELVSVQCYLEPLTGLGKTAALPKRSKQGDRYFDGGGTIGYYVGKLAPRERRKISKQVATDNLPPGKYRYWFSVQDPSDKVLSEASADFEIVLSKADAG